MKSNVINSPLSVPMGELIAKRADLSAQFAQIQQITGRLDKITDGYLGQLTNVLGRPVSHADAVLLLKNRQAPAQSAPAVVPTSQPGSFGTISVPTRGNRLSDAQKANLQRELTERQSKIARGEKPTETIGALAKRCKCSHATVYHYIDVLKALAKQSAAQAAHAA